MIRVRPAEQAGTAGKPGSRFTGDAFAYLTLPATDGVTINTVTFAPAARTYWHSHERGQILQVIAGRGLIQTRGEEPLVLRQGDTVWIPAGETHWHGAAPDSSLTHTAISLGVTDWLDPVVDYPGAAQAEETSS
ncbi:cupin domain-containing protein [Tersicoccus sp. MR15.9]|uniref:cupin domain-containing protein n=1 Tax=Tersicoccus mangrovi TaxID=3121635 RepID=UPI002FE6B69A